VHLASTHMTPACLTWGALQEEEYAIQVVENFFQYGERSRMEPVEKQATGLPAPAPPPAPAPGPTPAASHSALPAAIYACRLHQQWLAAVPCRGQWVYG